MRLISLFVTATTLLSPFIHADDGALISTLTNIPSRILTNPAVATSITTNARFSDLIVNIGKLYVDAEIEFDGKKQEKEHDGKKPYPSTGGGKKPVKVHDEEETPSAQDTSTDIDWAALFPELELSAEPAADEVVLGENNVTAADVSVQGGKQQDGVIIVSTPLIFSVTFKILQSKIITVAGADLTTSTIPKPKKELVTFVIRGQGFTVGGKDNFNSIVDFLSQKGAISTYGHGEEEEQYGRQEGVASFLAPRVFIGAIPLQVVQFTDTLIVARFLDLEDQRAFQPGAYVTRVKVLRFSQQQKDGKEIGILGGEESVAVATGIVAPTVLVGGLALPALGAVGGSFLSGPILPISGGKNDGLGGGLKGPLGGIGGHGAKQNAVTTGLEFFTAVLTVQFSVNDALSIRNSVPILDTWYD